jgi:hypothetical protein
VGQGARAAGSLVRSAVIEEQLMGGYICELMDVSSARVVGDRCDILVDNQC